MKRSKPYAIGLTGGIAAGKSHLAQALRDAGAAVIDADAIARELTALGGKALPAIRAAFGDDVFDEKALNRRRLADVIFHDAEKRAQLNAILHPMVFDEMALKRAHTKAPVVILEVPLLHETGYDAQCDEVWCAYVPQRVQMERLRERDGLSLRDARARLSSQMTGREKARRSTHVIRTDGPPGESAAHVVTLYRKTLAGLGHE